jgi:simple sugar transport system permease protein
LTDRARAAVAPAVTPSSPAAPAGEDERVRHVGLARRLLIRPEVGAAVGAVAVWAFFAITAGDKGFLTAQGTIGYLEIAAHLAILATPVAMLMIAGEFDLSLGSMIGTAGVVIAILISEFGAPPGLAIALAFSVAICVGFLNGFIVVRTGLPSFVVTLATLFILRGATVAVTRDITDRTQIGGLPQDGALLWLFGGKIGDVPVAVVWWVLIAALATWVLLRTRFGNWVFATGGDREAARNLGVPVGLVLIVLYITTAVAAALVATIQVTDAGSADVLRGQFKEFEAIAAAVIGGTLLSGGYGSALGATFGALIFAIVSQGIFYTGINTDWFQVFLGSMLLGAVLVNRQIRNAAMRAS